MKVLLVHSRDIPHRWASERWDRIIDLSWAPTNIYCQWTQELQCCVEPLEKYHRLQQDLDFVRKVSKKGKFINDKKNINWWELFILYFTEQIQLIASLRRLTESLDQSDQVFITRPCFEARVLDYLRKPPSCSLSKEMVREKIRDHAKKMWAMPLGQLREIFWDKYDTTFAIRARFTKTREAATAPLILIPSTYINTSRTAMSFATSLPDQNFLLVTTRESGRIRSAPKNVQTISLAAYSSKKSSTEEYADIFEAWQELRKELVSSPETAIMESLGLFNTFPKFVEQGLAIRDAWARVLDNEPVQAVLCCDNNPYTLLPVLLAKEKNIPTVSCHHGALDWRYRIMSAHADVILAKGRMEEDYLSRVCRVPVEKIKVGSPKSYPKILRKGESRSTSSIIFFSEAYEENKARGREFYKEVVTPLADLAIKTGRMLVVKLHPFESLRERQALVKEILTVEQQRVVQVVAGPLTSELLQHAWFGVTVLSTVAMECAGAGIPCFLCEWLQYPHHGYGEQFLRFNVGHPLQASAEIQNIPEILNSLPCESLSPSSLWHVIPPNELQQLFLEEKYCLAASS